MSRIPDLDHCEVTVHPTDLKADNRLAVRARRFGVVGAARITRNLRGRL